MAYGRVSGVVAMRKTYKREVTTASLLFLFGMFVWGVFEPSALDAAKYLTLPIFTIWGGAFGMDAYSKQIMGDE